MNYTGHRNRLKQKYLKNGFEGFADYEIVEFALMYAIPRKDVKPAAKELIKKFKTIKGILDADIKDLCKIRGISKHTAIFLKVLKDFVDIYLFEKAKSRKKVFSPQDVYNFLKARIGSRKDEEFCVIFLNSQNRIIDFEILEKGIVNRAIVYPRKIAEKSLEKKAVSVIVSHNHPGGSLSPSQEDRKITKKIKDALRVLDISLLDHIIITEEGYFSFKEKNLI